MSFITIMDIIGAIAGIFGCILVGEKNKTGYLLFMVCNICYMVLGWYQHFFGLVAVSIVMLIIDIIYFKKWSKE